MTDEDPAFLRAGFRYYPQAARTVERFIKVLYKYLQRGLADHWPSDSKFGYGKDVGEEPYIEVWRRVKFPNGEEATISVGLGWDGDQSYLFVYCADGPAWAKRATGPGFEPLREYNLLSINCDLPDLDISRAIAHVLDNFTAALRVPDT